MKLFNSHSYPLLSLRRAFGSPVRAVHVLNADINLVSRDLCKPGKRVGELGAKSRYVHRNKRCKKGEENKKKDANNHKK